MTNDYLKGFLLTALGTIILSFDALFIRLIDADSSVILFWRGILLSLFIAIFCKIKYPGQALFRSDWCYLRSTLLFAISSICFVMAINLTSVANALVIISVQPLFAALLSRVFLKERSPPITWVAIFFCLLGIAWVMLDSWQSPNLKGDLLALLCGLALSCKFVNDRSEKKLSMVPSLIGGGFIMSGFALFTTQSIMLSGNQWLWTTALCFFIVPLAFIFITLGPKRIPAAEVGMLMLLETVIGPIWIWIFLHVAPNTAALQGGSVVVITLICHTLLRVKIAQRKRLK
ncbi:MAG: drug/metabolite transporter (DMT)-like permease [Oceanospirillaceae bacterium]